MTFKVYSHDFNIYLDLSAELKNVFEYLIFKKKIFI